jgi:hypothetical protein
MTDETLEEQIEEMREDIALLEDKLSHMDGVMLALVKTLQETQQAVADTFDVPCGALFSDSYFRATNDAHSSTAEDIVYGTPEEP